MREIRFDVGGQPPAKSEAKSMLGAGHGHAPRVRALLKAARGALRGSNWQLTDEPIGLEIAVSAAARERQSDATNYLGGIGDVLQVKTGPLRGIDLSHLGELRQVALYEDDSQIREIRYSRSSAPVAGYSVRVWVLEGPKDRPRR